MRINPLANISRFLPINSLNRFTSDTKIDDHRKPSNVTVIQCPIYYGPSDSQYQRVGEKHYHCVLKILKKQNIQFDFIFCHFLYTAGYVGAKLKKIYNVPLFVVGHGYDVYDLPFRNDRYQTMIRYVLITADIVVTVSNRNRQLLEKLNEKRKYHVIPNGFDDKLFYPMDQRKCREKLDLPLDKKIVLTIGNLIEVKGQEYLVEAINNVKDEFEDVYCLIVGDGKFHGVLSKKIEKLSLTEYVKLVGRKPHKDIPFWINACNVFVLPSLNEGNPTVMFEVLGCGKPFVGTKVGGIPDIIISDDYGYLCETRDSTILADQIKNSLKKTWNNDQIVKYASQFSWNTIDDQIMHVFKKIENTEDG